MATDFDDRTVDRLRCDIAGALRRASRPVLKLTPTAQEAEAWQRAKSRIDEKGASWDADLSQAVFRYVAEKNGPEFGQQAAKTLFASAKSGDLHAIDRLTALTGEFVRGHAEELAGVEQAKTADQVKQDGADRISRVTTHADDVQRDAKRRQDVSMKAATESGVRPSESMKGTAQEIVHMSGRTHNEATEKAVPSDSGRGVPDVVEQRIAHGSRLGAQILDSAENSFVPKAINDLSDALSSESRGGGSSNYSSVSDAELLQRMFAPSSSSEARGEIQAELTVRGYVFSKPER